MEELTIKPRILLALPDGRIHKLKLFGDHYISFREAPLTLTTLAALVPPNINATLIVVDESVQKIPMDQSFDLVALSCLTEIGRASCRETVYI